MVTRLRYPKGYQFFDGNGSPLALGNLFYYVAGTTTLQDTYSDSAGTIANTNPIVLDGSGRLDVDVYLGSTSDYKEVLAGSSATISPWPDDNILRAMQIDWNATSGPSQILNKPALATVAISGSYTDLVNAPAAPVVFTGDSGAGGLAGLVPAPVAGSAVANKFLKADGTWSVPPGGSGSTATNLTVTETINTVTIASSSGSGATIPAATSTAAGVLDSARAAKIDGMAAVATSGSYNDLSNKPTLPTAPSNMTGAAAGSAGAAGLAPAPAAGQQGAFLRGDGTWAAPSFTQVNPDWNATSGAGQILNKPALAPVATSGSYTDLTNQPTSFNGNTFTLPAYNSSFGTWYSGITGSQWFGSQGTLAGVTANATNGSTAVTLSVGHGLSNGQYVSIAGLAGAFVLSGVGATSATLNRAAAATVSNAAVQYVYHVDPYFQVGYNPRALSNPSEPEFVTNYEVQYLSSDGYDKCEWYLQYSAASGGTQVRPYFAQINRTSNLISSAAIDGGYGGVTLLAGPGDTTDVPAFHVRNTSGTPFAYVGNFNSSPPNVAWRNLNVLNAATSAIAAFTSNGTLAHLGANDNAGSPYAELYTLKYGTPNTNIPLVLQSQGGNVAFGTVPASSVIYDLTFGGDAYRTIGLARATGTAADFTIKAGGAKSGASNAYGGNLWLSSGISTGSAGSNIYFQVYEPGATGAADNSATTAAQITSSGCFGIGSGVAPAAPLHVQLPQLSGSDSNRSAALFTDWYNAGSSGGYCALTTVTGSGGLNGWNLSAANNSRLSFGAWSGSYSTAPNEYLTILPSGNVGVGTNAPSAPFHLQPPVLAGADSNRTVQLVTDSYNGGSSSVHLALTTLTSGGSNTGWNLSTDWNKRLSFGVSTSGYTTAPNENLTIVSGGNVGIGTTSPANTLDVNGVVRVASAAATPAGGSSSVVLLFGTTAGFGIYAGSGAPTVSAAQGSLYLRSDGSSTSTRLYINTGGTAWTNVATAA